MQTVCAPAEVAQSLAMPVVEVRDEVRSCQQEDNDSQAGLDLDHVATGWDRSWPGQMIQDSVVDHSKGFSHRPVCSDHYYADQQQ